MHHFTIMRIGGVRNKVEKGGGGEKLEEKSVDGGKMIKKERHMIQDKMKARMRRGSIGRDRSQAVKYYMCREKPYNSAC